MDGSSTRRRRGPQVSRVARVSRVALAVIVASLVSFAACAKPDGLDGSSGEPRANVDEAGRDNPCGKNLDDDHDDCGACGNACGEIEHCLAGKCAPGCPDHVVYVSADGNDGASGCTTATPKRTIGAAIALLKTLGAERHEIHACRGQYGESVVLDYRAALLGGYECSTWKRSAGYGAPTFDGVNETVVLGTPAAPPLTIATVDGVTVDGLTLRAFDDASAPSVGVVARDGARAKLSSSKMLAARGKQDNTPGSVGLLVDTGAFVDVTTSIIDGGSGPTVAAGGYGSAGIFLTAKAGGIHVIDTRINGGSGAVTGGTGSVGILALGASTASAVESSIVNGGSGRTGAGSASYGMAFFASSAPEVTLADSVIEGGSGACASGCSVTGASITTKGKVRVTGNRITGGDAKSEAVAGEVSFSGLRLADYASADVQNNSIFTGNLDGRRSGGATALSLTRGGNALVANNTLALGTSSTPGSLVVATAKTATLANNLFLNAAATAPGAVIDLDACAAQTYALQNNAWVGFAEGAQLVSVKRGPVGSCTYASDATVEAAEARARLAFGAANVGGNRRISNACTADALCTAVPGACATGRGCIATVLTAWDAATAGDLLGAGWRLGTATACAITKGGLPLPGLLAVDASGAARTDPRSMGAHEHDGVCQ